jgi:hypothetical protein
MQRRPLLQSSPLLVAAMAAVDIAGARIAAVRRAASRLTSHATSTPHLITPPT